MSEVALASAVVEALSQPGWVEARDEGDALLRVELALTFPYAPNVGDTLLVIGEAGEHYAIGVLGAAAPRALDLGRTGELHADGPLTLGSEEAVELDAPRLHLRARAVRTFAGRLHERAAQVDTWVRGLLTQRAGEARRVVAGADETQAQRWVTLARGKVKLDADVLDVGH